MFRMFGPFYKIAPLKSVIVCLYYIFVPKYYVAWTI